ncbi:ABC transporter substrate-binding protein [Falsihalocynthiibacter sp. SS001]|uniref:ABC transporter substrate-binding protein n=1 Tax=Falsihalocynthiibacter sp. SS001 TaxID=3349698 RepID=UPI0036D3D048
MKRVLTTALIASFLATTASYAHESCAHGKTLTPDVLTIATGNPAYFPWVIDNDPTTGEGFEAAVAYEVAKRMGFEKDAVEWTTATFDQSIQPGSKEFDLNLQQFSITEEREKVVDFSEPYYSAAMAVLVRQPTVDAGATGEMESLKSLKWGVMGTSTALKVVSEVIAPSDTPLLYDDNVNVIEAMKANQIDAAIFDLPTALYLSAVVLEDGALIGQFPADRSENPDQFGFLMEEGSALKSCVDEALAAMKSDGTLAAIESQWLAETTGVPVLK